MVNKFLPNLQKNSLLRDPRSKVLLLLSLFLSIYLLLKLMKFGTEWTDNAIVQCDIIDVISEVNGIIKNISFDDNSSTQKGQTLVSLRDDMFKASASTFQAEYNTSKGELELAKRKQSIDLLNIDSRINILRARLNAAQSKIDTALLEVREVKDNLNLIAAQLEYSKSDFNRIKVLVNKKSVSKKQYDDAEEEYKTSQYTYNAIKSKLEAKESELKTLEALKLEAEVNLNSALDSKDIVVKRLSDEVKTASSKVEIAKAKLDEASIMLDRTKIVALRSGEVTNRRVAQGDFIEVGQPIASITSCRERAWVEANFKETQIGKMRIGQRVDLHMDTYPDDVFSGEIESISTGSGSIFSVLPPENATGNFTKVVQRFPVKIKIIGDNFEKLKIGMSAEVTVHIDDKAQ